MLSSGCVLLQVLTHADTCHAMGLIDEHEKVHAMELQMQVAGMISQGECTAIACQAFCNRCTLRALHVYNSICHPSSAVRC